MNQVRRNISKSLRVSAAEYAFQREYPSQASNSDEKKFRFADDHLSYMAAFTKGLQHDFSTGLMADPKAYEHMVSAVLNGDCKVLYQTKRDIFTLPKTQQETVWYSESARKLAVESLVDNCIPFRVWETTSSVNDFTLVGADPQSISMPPAPAFGSAELTAEIGELYTQSLLRDIPFSDIDATVTDQRSIDSISRNKCNIPLDVIIDELRQLAWFDAAKNQNNYLNETAQDHILSPHQIRHLRPKSGLCNLFRIPLPGNQLGPNISQLLMLGELNEPVPEPNKLTEINWHKYVAHTKVEGAPKEKDYMQSWREWIDVQNGADFRQTSHSSVFTTHDSRYITTPRDLAIFVRSCDVLDLFNQTLHLLFDLNYQQEQGEVYDAGHLSNEYWHHTIFLASLLAQAAAGAMKAVRYQKYAVHRRLRPEQLAGRLCAQANGKLSVPELHLMQEKLAGVLDLVNTYNNHKVADDVLNDNNYLLSQVYPEGSPLSPSYGDYNAAIAGACCTVLKTYFDHSKEFAYAGKGSALVPSTNGTMVKRILLPSGALTLEGELNKLASNIATGGCWAGVTFYSDAIESLYLGEKVAITIMQEHKLTQNNSKRYSLPLFDGTTMTI